MASIYDFTVVDIEGKEVHMSQFRDRVLLIVNTASKCGFTPQFEGLEGLWRKYKKYGFVVLGFPCNQFMMQEFDTSEEILSYCTTYYDVTFPMFEKVRVNGSKAHPLFKYLRENTAGFIINDVKWNFTKFLVDRDGTVLKRFSPQERPEKLEEEIVEVLRKS